MSFLKMKLLFVFWFVTVTSAYTVNHIEGLNRSVQLIGFDYSGNAYAITGVADGPEQLHKINSTKQLEWTIDLPSKVDFAMDILANRQNDVFLYCYSWGSGMSLYVLKSGSKIVEEVAPITGGYISIYMDQDGNLFYNEGINGVKLLRSNSSIPISIKNLEEFNMVYEFLNIIDKNGNIYFPVLNLKNEKHSLALLTKESLMEEIPHAQIFDVTDDSQQSIGDLVVDEVNNLWIEIYDIYKEQVFIKKLTNNGLEILADGDYVLEALIGGEDKIYFLQRDQDGFAKIFYMTLDNYAVEIPELNKTSGIFIDGDYVTRGLSDHTGTVYFKTYPKFSDTLGPVIVINRNESHPKTVFPENTNAVPSEIYLDFNDDLWILTSDEVYYFKKGGTAPELVNSPEDFKPYSVEINSKVEEIYVLTQNGIYVIVDEK